MTAFSLVTANFVILTMLSYNGVLTMTSKRRGNEVTNICGKASPSFDTQVVMMGDTCMPILYCRLVSHNAIFSGRSGQHFEVERS